MEFYQTLLLIFVANIPSICCIVGAIVLAVKKCGGWGWFLFVAALLHTTIGSLTYFSQ